jgi:hypothetical protein
MYEQNQLVRGRMRLRGEHVDLGRIEQTCSWSPPAPTSSRLFPTRCRSSTWCAARTSPTSSHIGVMADRARKENWPDLAGWLAERSGP